MNFTRASSHPPVFTSRRLVLSVWPLRKHPLVSHLTLGLWRYPVLNCPSAHFTPVVIVRTGVAPARLEFDLRGPGGRVEAAAVICVQCRGETAIILELEGKTLIRKTIHLGHRNGKDVIGGKTINPVKSRTLLLFLCNAAFRFRSYSQGQMKKYKVYGSCSSPAQNDPTENA